MDNIWLGKIVRMSAFGLGSLIYTMATPVPLPVYNVTDSFVLDILITHSMLIKAKASIDIPSGYKLRLKSEYREVDIEFLDRDCNQTHCVIKVKVLDVRN